MTKTQISLPLLALTSALALTGCVTPGGTISTGSAPTAASGAAGGCHQCGCECFVGAL